MVSSKFQEGRQLVIIAVHVDDLITLAEKYIEMEKTKENLRVRLTPTDVNVKLKNEKHQ